MTGTKDKTKLRYWQEIKARAESDWERERSRMDRREALYRGDRYTRPVVREALSADAPHVRNIVMELIEAQVDSNIPQPKVTPRREEDEQLARVIEDMLRNELDRMPFEAMNDMMARTVPVQGGGVFLVEWDNTLTTPRTVGELVVSVLHPKQIIPQDGVTSGVEDMDYIILAVPQTKEYIRRRYGVSVEHDTEEKPELRTSEGGGTADDLVTHYMAYYRNDNGGIGRYSWVQDTEIEDLEDYQARRLNRCATCGAAEQTNEDLTAMPVSLLRPDADEEPLTVERKRDDRKICPHCGGDSWHEAEELYEELYLPVKRTDGREIPGASFESEEVTGEDGLPRIVDKLVPTRIPFYKPNIYPIILQKNTGLFGHLLGGSDVDAIEDQQNTTNRIHRKIIDKLMSSGSYMTLPDDCSIEVNDEDMKVVRPSGAADASLIAVHDMEGNVSQDVAYLAQVYEEARQVIGITDSFQGRRDATATSGKAKEFAAAQSAGRLESKRIMKQAAYAALFEAMFKFKLAYADEPRPVTTMDENGKRSYGVFNRYDFLEQDATGAWYWNDRFLFSCDPSAPLANNREAMWQEARMNLQTGAFGDPSALQTLILFWKRMEQLHYPGAGDTRDYLERQLSTQQQMMQQAASPLNAAMQVGELPDVPSAGAAGLLQKRTPGTNGSGISLPTTD